MEMSVIELIIVTLTVPDVSMQYLDNEAVTMTIYSGNMSGLKSAVVQEGDSGRSNAVICVFLR